MKITKTQLKQIIKEQIEASGSDGQQLVQKIQDFFNSLEGEAGSLGANISLEDFHKIQQISTQFLNSVKSSRRKAQAANRDPEAKKLAAQKGLDTKMSNKRREADIDAMMRKKAEERKAREDGGGLPLTADDYRGKPDLSYYEFSHLGQDAVNYYKLKDKYRNMKFSPETKAKILNPNKTVSRDPWFSEQD